VQVAELGPGVVRVDYLPDSAGATPASDEWFIPGGFAFKHADNSMDVSTIEGVRLDLVDTEALRAAATDAAKRRDAAAAGSKEAAEAKLALETFRTLSL